MSSITFRSMGDAMKAGREAKSQGYPAAALAKWAKALPRMFPPGTGKGETLGRYAGAPRNLARPRRLRSGCGQLCGRRQPGWLPWLRPTTQRDSQNNSMRLTKPAVSAMPAIKQGTRVHPGNKHRAL